MDPTENAQHTARLFSALRGGLIRSISREDDTIRFQVHLPKLAAARNPDFTFFYCSLSQCSHFSLQPFRNTDTEISQLETIERLSLRIHHATAGPGSSVSVFCGHKGSDQDDSGRISVRAAGFHVWDEAFDPVSDGDLDAVRSQKGV